MFGKPNQTLTTLQWRRKPLRAHRPHGPLHKQTAYGLCRRHMKAFYNQTHDGERSRDAYAPDKDG